jgi:hypothetical protein
MANAEHEPRLRPGAEDYMSRTLTESREAAEGFSERVAALLRSRGAEFGLADDAAQFERRDWGVEPGAPDEVDNTYRSLAGRITDEFQVVRCLPSERRELFGG